MIEGLKLIFHNLLQKNGIGIHKEKEEVAGQESIMDSIEDMVTTIDKLRTDQNKKRNIMEVTIKTIIQMRTKNTITLMLVLQIDITQTGMDVYLRMMTVVHYRHLTTIEGDINETGVEAQVLAKMIIATTHMMIEIGDVRTIKGKEIKVEVGTIVKAAVAVMTRKEVGIIKSENTKNTNIEARTYTTTTKKTEEKIREKAVNDKNLRHLKETEVAVETAKVAKEDTGVEVGKSKQLLR